MKQRLPKLFALCAIILGFLVFWMDQTSEAEVQTSECLSCHRNRNLNTNEGILSSQLFCYDCHLDPTTHPDFRDTKVSLQVKPEYFQGSSHRFVACVQCHTDVARSPHRSSEGVNCLSCHVKFYGEPGTHAEHIRVRCESCHTDSSYVQLDRLRNEIQLSHFTAQSTPVRLSEHKVTDVQKKEFCLRCHNSSNQVGAPAAVLPSKSFVCFACHYAPLRFGNPIFIVSTLIALIGIIGILAFWFKARVADETSSVHRKIQLGSEIVWSKIFSREIFPILKTVFFDIFLQRRILANGVSRWFVHSLIFYPFFARFVLSLFTLFVQRISPASGLAMTLVNRNSGFVATFNDITGVMILVGVVWAMFRRYVSKPEYVATQEQDTVALVIIGLVTLTGFIVEGARILITQLPPHIALSAFAGYFISKILSISNVHWATAYGYLWYLHATLWALFIAYFPFGKLKHIFTTPLSLILNYKKE
ncbi:MAG: respiratory nitrate reductase subunit gamma [Desulfomonilaceae bacterium]